VTDPKRTAAVILAAGAATRFGAAKVFAPLGGRPLVDRVIDAAVAAGLAEIVVVLGPASSVEASVDLGRVRIVRNPRPEDGLSSSVRVGLEALGAALDAAVVLLGDQPLVRAEVIRALLGAEVPAGRSIVVPRYAGGGGQNPTLVLREGWPLAAELIGDRGFGPLITAHPELVVEIPADGSNPDVDTPADLAIVAWGAQVKANRDQVDRIREVADGDFYATTTGLFRADPRRPDTEDATLAALRALSEAGETWLDIGAGAGRYAMPLALTVGSGGEVIAVDPSSAMLGALRNDMADFGIGNIRVIEGRWPLGEGILPVPAADVSLIAHVGYDIEAIGPFVDAMEAATRRLCVAVMMERTPASVAEPFWPPVHGEERIPLPALPAFVDLLEARGRAPEVRMVERGDRSFPDRDAALGFVRRQTWVTLDGVKDHRLQEVLDERILPRPDGTVFLRDVPDLAVGVITWEPR
jgi:CTP:molybdopterin cytidylyltransferase MocA/SAM-dependent methyltransferase